MDTYLLLISLGGLLILLDLLFFGVVIPTLVGAVISLSSAVIYCGGFSISLGTYWLLVTPILILVGYLFGIMIRRSKSGVSEGAEREFCDHEFILDSDCSEDSVCTHRYSGVDWKVESDESISAGVKVKVVAVKVGVLEVKPI